jgi:hypothetical protein
MSFDNAENEVFDGIEAATSNPVSTANISVDNKEYRTYGVIELDEKGKEVFKAKTKEGKTLADPLVRQKTADGKAWTSAEESGNTVLAENILVFYTLETLAGFEELVPSEEQRLWLVNKGIASIQTAAAQKIQSELTEDGQFAYNGETVDLREFINKAPERKKLSETQKVMRDITALSPDAQKQMIELLLQLQQNS